MGTGITVHYRRHLGDYEGWSLWTWAAGDSEVSSSASSSAQPPRAVAPAKVPGSRVCPATDEWGAIFHVATPLPGWGLGFLPRLGSWVAVDGGDRVLPAESVGEGTHVYVLQGERAAYASVAGFVGDGGAPRFVRIHVDAEQAVEAGLDAWPNVLSITAEGTNYVVEAFVPPPADGCSGGGVVVVDRAAFPSDTSRLGLTLAPVGGGGTNGHRTQAPSCWWAPDDGADVKLIVSTDGASLRADSGATAARQAGSRVAVAAPPAAAVAVCGSASDAASGNGGQRAPPLIVRYQRYASDYEGWSLEATPADGGARLPVSRAARLYHGMATYEVDVPAGWAAASRLTLCLTPPSAAAVAAAVEAAGPTATAAGRGKDTVAARMWTLAAGKDVVVAQDSGDVRPLHAMTRQLFYHRMEALTSDWRDWRLRLWTTVEAPARRAAATGKVVSAAPPSPPVVDRSHELLPRELIAPGVIAYDLTPLLFRAGDTVHVRPVKVEPVVSPPEGGHGGKEPDMAAAVREVAADVARSWTILPGVVPRRQIVQGHPTIYREASEFLGDGGGDATICGSALRWFAVRYRRFVGGADAYAGWVLWGCDDDAVDASVGGVAIEPVLVDPVEGALFLVDRGWFGDGSRLRLVPRHAERAIDDADATVTWDVDAADAAFWIPAAVVDALVAGGDVTPPPALLLVQGHGSLLTSLAAEPSPVVVSVDSPWDVAVTTFCPLEWLDGTAPAKPWDPAASPSIRPKLTLRHGQAELPWVTWERPSPTEIVLRLSEAVAHGRGLHEDYLVEEVVARAAGLPTLALQWRRHANVDAYFYPGTMGCVCTASETVFRVFAPTADGVAVVLYDGPGVDASRREVPMRRISQGCWKAIVPSSLGGTYYKLLASGADTLLFPGVEVIDPYSRCNTHHTGRGLILAPDDPAVVATVAPRPPVGPDDAVVIWELHLRDATVDPASGVVGHRGKYLGLAQRDTVLVPGAPFAADAKGMVDVSAGADAADTAKSAPAASGEAGAPPVSTALAHLVEMGATAVQVLPLQDFDNNEDEAVGEYAWGYMPVHFFSPDGWYASGSRTDSTRVRELKELVSAMHEAGLRVILDVVFNHTAEDVNERNLDARFSFNGVAPRYYYRTCGNTPLSASGHRTCALTPASVPTCGGCYSNGSGCGNEMRSEAPMARKFIIDCLRYWATEYGMDGFRFDLMGLVDVPTLTAASAALKAIDDGILLYGEPWTGGITPMAPTYKGTQRGRGFGVFNDTFRDALRGSPFHVSGCFVLDGVCVDEIKQGIMGSIDDFADAPTEVINYVACHDNRTLYDQLWEIYRGGGEDTDADVAPPEEEPAGVGAVKDIGPAPDATHLSVDAATAVATAAADAAAAATRASAAAAAASVPALLRRCAALATAIVLTAQGVPFLQLGQEFFRTKGGDHNSYISADAVNAVRWARKAAHGAAVRFVAGLVALRREHPEIFALPTAGLVRDRLLFFETMGVPVPAGCIAYRVDGCAADVVARAVAAGATAVTADEQAARWTAVLVLINPCRTAQAFALPEAEQLWVPVVAGGHAGFSPVGAPVRRQLGVAPTSLTVLRRCSAAEADAAAVDDRLAVISDPGVVPADGDCTSRYAVGLERKRGAAEAAVMEENVRLRRAFLGETEVAALVAAEA